MTRGRGILIYDGPDGAPLMDISIEFNGDMYASGYGQDFADFMKGVYSRDHFRKQISAFNKRRYGYPEGPIWREGLPVPSPLSAHEHGYSDYTFILNLSSRPVLLAFPGDGKSDHESSPVTHYLPVRTLAIDDFGHCCNQMDDLDNFRGISPLPDTLEDAMSPAFAAKSRKQEAIESLAEHIEKIQEELAGIRKSLETLATAEAQGL
ncbi:MAG: hypothetical protein IJ083_06095 [Clostridia bacterium]|nr:hypothetical protein [Clostridia bacterium]